MKVAELVAVPPGVVTTIFPVVAVDGTVAVIWLSLFTMKVPVLPPNVTLVVCVKPVPVIVTTVPIGPLVGLMVLMVGVTRKMWLLTSVPPDVTTLTEPVFAPVGTFAVI